MLYYVRTKLIAFDQKSTILFVVTYNKQRFSTYPFLSFVILGHSDSSVDVDISYNQSHHTAESSRAIIKRIKDMSYGLIDPAHLNEFYDGLKELEDRFQPLVQLNENGNLLVKRNVDSNAVEKPMKRMKRKIENC